MPDRKRILVINDTKEILELFRDILEGEMGHEVVLMSFAPDELSRIVEERPDLVIIDFVIGQREMEGWQLLQKLRMHPTTVGIPVVACTAAIQAVREQEAYLLEQGVEVVMKPFTVDQLEGAVSRALRLSGSERKPWEPRPREEPAERESA
ncbi:MAG TPA: response regulator [Candidatus Limnocylindria bacterium]|jgi:CheY-like chemotaxis protein|nr:response regulator [Candidatus Limnocylindria bacterium]